MAVAKIKTELLSSNDTIAEDQAGTASSYFSSQLGSGLESKHEESNPFVPADLFQSSQDFTLHQQQLPEPHQQVQEPNREAEGQPQQQPEQQQQPTEDLTAWYQSELAK